MVGPDQDAGAAFGHSASCEVVREHPSSYQKSAPTVLGRATVRPRSPGGFQKAARSPLPPRAKRGVCGVPAARRAARDFLSTGSTAGPVARSTDTRAT